MIKELANDLALRFDENTHFNPFHALPNSRNRSVKHTFLFLFQALRGTSQPQTCWYKQPAKRQVGLLDYVIAMPVEAAAIMLIVAATIIGFLTPLLLIIAMFAAVDNNSRYQRSNTAFFEGWIIGSWLSGNSFANGFGVLSVGCAIICGVIAYGTLMPIRWFLNEILVTTLAGIIAGIATLPVYIGQKISVGCQTLFKNNRSEPSYAHTGSSTATMQQQLSPSPSSNYPNDPPPPYSPYDSGLGQQPSLQDNRQYEVPTQQPIPSAPPWDDETLNQLDPTATLLPSYSN